MLAGNSSYVSRASFILCVWACHNPLHLIQAAVLLTLVEHKMPLTYGPVMVEVAKELAKDWRALGHLHLHRTTCSYLVTDGIAYAFSERLVVFMKSSCFSVTIDEAPSANNKKI